MSAAGRPRGTRALVPAVPWPVEPCPHLLHRRFLQGWHLPAPWWRKRTRPVDPTGTGRALLRTRHILLSVTSKRVMYKCAATKPAPAPTSAGALGFRSAWEFLAGFYSRGHGARFSLEWRERGKSGAGRGAWGGIPQLRSHQSWVRTAEEAQMRRTAEHPQLPVKLLVCLCVK